MFEQLLVLILCVTYSLSLYKQNRRIVKLTGENYDVETRPDQQPILINVYSTKCRSCKDLVDEFNSLTMDLKEIAKFATINFDREKELAHKLGITNHHKMYILKETNLEPFQGPVNSQSIVNVIMNSVLKKLGASESNKDYRTYVQNVEELTDATFDEMVLGGDHYWMVLFFNPRNFDSQKMIPLWYRAAETLTGQVKFGSIDVSHYDLKAGDYNIGKFPTALLLIREVEYFLHFNYHLTADYIVEWTLNKIKEYDEESDVMELTSQNRYDVCQSKPLCIVAFLPHIFDCQSDCRNKYLDMLFTVNEKYKDFKWGWLWTEGGSQTDLEKSLNVDTYSYPKLVAISPQRSKYVPFRGRFSDNGIDEFLRNILHTKHVGSDVKKNIIISDVELWDGNDRDILENAFDFYGMDVSRRDEL